jgi:hypothetical protein
MKDTFYNLYLAKTSKIPKDKNGNDFDVVYCLEIEKEISSELELNSNLRYIFIVLQKTRENLYNGMENVKLEWESFSNSSIEIEYITNDLKQIKKEFRKLFLKCDDETVIFKSQVVGFDKTSKKELNTARKLILGVSTKSKWNFWD